MKKIVTARAEPVERVALAKRLQQTYERGLYPRAKPYPFEELSEAARRAWLAVAAVSLQRQRGRRGKRKPCECSTFRIALRDLATCPVVAGQSAHIRDHSRQRGVPDPLRAAQVLTGLPLKAYDGKIARRDACPNPGCRGGTVPATQAPRVVEPPCSTCLGSGKYPPSAKAKRAWSAYPKLPRRGPKKAGKKSKGASR